MPEVAPKLARMSNVEIFASGVWEENGDEYTDEDLKDMVENFRQFSSGENPLHDASVAPGHEEHSELLEATDYPSWGRVSWVWRDKSSGVLKANFEDVNPDLADWVNGKQFRRVSAEIYDDPPEGIPGQGKMLRRVSLLGHEPPKVKGLKALPMAQFSEQSAKAIQIGIKAGRAQWWRGPVFLRMGACDGRSPC